MQFLKPFLTAVFDDPFLQHNVELKNAFIDHLFSVFVKESDSKTIIQLFKDLLQPEFQRFLMKNLHD